MSDTLYKLCGLFNIHCCELYI